MSKRRKSVSDDVLPDPSPIEITDSQECIPCNHDEVFKPFDNSEDDPLPQEDGSDTASDPITSDCEEDTSEHRLEFVMKMPDCVVDPESREKVIRYFQQEQGGTNCVCTRFRSLDGMMPGTGLREICNRCLGQSTLQLI